MAATGGMTTERGHFVVPKDEVPYPLWNRLIGEQTPGRRTEGSAEGTR